MSGFVRRSTYDLNFCIFQGRVTDTPIMETHVRKSDKKEIEVVRFQIVCNSNPFSPRQATYYRCYAYGIKGQKIYAKIKKGYTLVVIAEGKSTTIKADKKKGVPSYQLNEFEAKWVFVDSVPNGEEKEIEPRTNTKNMFMVRDLKSIAQILTDTELDYADAAYEGEGEDPE